jgi:hypothetical protein
MSNQTATTVRVAPGIRAGIRLARIPSDILIDVATAFSVGRVRWPRTGLSCTEPQRVSAMSRSPEALAFGSRRHFIPASLSLPLCGCLLNRSRDCSRSRVPPRFPRRRSADAPAAATFCCLRFASARSALQPKTTLSAVLSAALRRYPFRHPTLSKRQPRECAVRLPEAA